MQDTELKEWVRVDGNEDDAILTALEAAARQYITNSTGFTNWPTANDLVKTAVRMLVSRWYENREAIGSADELGHGFDNILRQLRWTPGAGEVTTDASS